MNTTLKAPFFSKLTTILEKDEQRSPVALSEKAMRMLTETETMAVSGGPESEVGAGGEPG
ncbi:MAG: hypothetical protein V4488_23970 [Pseudomonadota bacterium]